MCSEVLTSWLWPEPFHLFPRDLPICRDTSLKVKILYYKMTTFLATFLFLPSEHYNQYLLFSFLLSLIGYYA